MVENATRRGTLERTRRAREQDLALVMGNDPLRAIIELVTNADDAYEAMLKGPRRKIRVEVERHRGSPTIISVRDQAESMTRTQAEERLGKEGGRTSGFERGDDRRGLLGRGAKDIVHFGRVEWDLKTRAGEHCVFRFLYKEGMEQDWESEALGTVDRKRHGTDAILHVQQQFRVPNHDNVAQNLTRHYAMRPILQDRRNRDVIVVDKGQGTQERLVYEPPSGTLLAEKEKVEILGYRGQFATFDLTELVESVDDGKPREFWNHSLIIISGRAAYDIFEGKFRREPWRNFLGKLSGTVNVPGINQLIRDFDDREELGENPDPSNPVRLLKRDRTGLVREHEHPFMAALTKTIEELVQPHLDRMGREYEESRTPISERTRQRNIALGRLFGRLLDEEEHGADGAGAQNGTLPPIGLSIIPGSRVVPADSPAWVTVRFRPDSETMPSPSPTVALVVTDEEKTIDESLDLVPRSGYFSRGYSLGARSDGEISSLTAKLDGHEADCIIEWQYKQSAPVADLTFEHANYSIKDGQSRTIRLLAPWEMVSTNDELPGIQLLGSSNITRVGQVGSFRHYEQRDCAMCDLEVKGRGIGSTAILIARLADTEVRTQLTVNAIGAGDLRIEIEKHSINQCAWMEDSGNKLVINANSPSIARYLGDPDRNWPGQEGIHFRTMLAEIATYTVARHVIQTRHQQGKEDVFAIFAQYSQLVEKWLPRVHSTLVPGSEINHLWDST